MVAHSQVLKTLRWKNGRVEERKIGKPLLIWRAAVSRSRELGIGLRSEVAYGKVWPIWSLTSTRRIPNIAGNCPNRVPRRRGTGRPPGPDQADINPEGLRSRAVSQHGIFLESQLRC
jgi:hypothetical protein